MANTQTCNEIFENYKKLGQLFTVRDILQAEKNTIKKDEERSTLSKLENLIFDEELDYDLQGKLIENIRAGFLDVLDGEIAYIEEEIAKYNINKND